VRHLLEILGEDMRSQVAAAVRRPLSGLKVACYYGCLLSRPPEITHFDDAENPMLMDRLLDTAGATVVDWPHKTECCGASFSITDPSIILDLTDSILAMAQAAGVDCIATACPLCQLNLDMRQKDIAAKRGHRYDLPVFYFTQLLGLAMGCSDSELSLGSLFVDPHPLLRAKGLEAGARLATEVRS
jgi:heterodisulfide reductase subunit B